MRGSLVITAISPTTSPCERVASTLRSPPRPEVTATTPLTMMNIASPGSPCSAIVSPSAKACSRAIEAIGSRSGGGSAENSGTFRRKSTRSIVESVGRVSVIVLLARACRQRDARSDPIVGVVFQSLLHGLEFEARRVPSRSSAGVGRCHAQPRSRSPRGRWPADLGRPPRGSRARRASGPPSIIGGSKAEHRVALGQEEQRILEQANGLAPSSSSAAPTVPLHGLLHGRDREGTEFVGTVPTGSRSSAASAPARRCARPRSA